MALEKDVVLLQQKAIATLTDRLMKAIRVVAAILGMTFVYLELQNAPLDKITQAFDSNSGTKLGLFLFFTGWAAGALDDTKIKKMAFALDPDEGKIGMEEYSAIAVFLTIFSALFIIHESLFFFQISLLFFIIINSWTYSVVIMKRSNKIIERSERFYLENSDNISFFKLHCAVEYLTGNWQRRRFITLIALAGLQVLFAAYLRFVGMHPVMASVALNGVPGSVLIPYAPSALFLVYVLISEGWMKIYRLKIFSDFNTLENMRVHYGVARIRNAPLPVINHQNLFVRGHSTNENFS